MKLLFPMILLLTFAGHAQGPKKPEALVYKPRSQSEIASEALAQAGPSVITSREVLISYILDQALATPIKKAGVPERKNWLLNEKDEAYAKHLAQILLEVVVQLEAENFSIGAVSQEELTQAQKHIEEQ